MTWRTPIGPGGKAHHFGADGKSACANRKGIWPGCTFGDLFTRPQRESTSEDHVCTYCALKFPRQCECWRCQLRRAGAMRPGRTGAR